jgi:2-dehydro-3-deoxy-D-arabinonate dehydratase
VRLYRTPAGPVVEEDGRYHALAEGWDELVCADDLALRLSSARGPEVDAPASILAPIEGQEVWAAGVTYWRSRDARREESAAAGGASFYDKRGTIAGYTIGNDLSCRDIEGENPLYLPQAKTFDGCAALGPCVLVGPRPTEIRLAIHRGADTPVTGSARVDQLRRQPEELVQWLFREASFPLGCFLLTGTGIVPPDRFSLQPGDRMEITIEPIGTLVNFV